MAAMSVSLQPGSKLLDLIDRLRRHPRTSVKDLERFIGLALWACNLFPVMKSQLRYLYKDLFSPGASHFSVGPDYWPEVKDCLRQDLRFFRTPPGTAIPVNSKLLSIRHKELSSLADLEKIIVQDKRLWLRVVNPKSSRRRLSKASLAQLSGLASMGSPIQSDALGSSVSHAGAGRCLSCGLNHYCGGLCAASRFR